MTYPRLLAHDGARRDSYGQVRRDTLNFETCGGERHSRHDRTLAPVGQLLQFPVRIARHIFISVHRKEQVMSNEINGDVTSPGSNSSTSRRSELERTETFAPAGAIKAKIFTRSGDVVVRSEPGAQLEVTLSASSSKFAHLLEDATIVFNEKRNELEVHTQRSDRGARPHAPSAKSKRSWFDFGGADLDVSVVVPSDSDLDVATVSGDTAILGPFGDVCVSSVSGDVVALDPCDTLEVRTASGDVRTGHVRTKLSCKSASGDVECLGSASSTEIISASGDVVVSTQQPGKVVVKAVSGDVHVRVARGLAVDVNGNTVSGDMGTNIDLDASSDAVGDEEQVYIKISTVSGDIRIDKAS